MKALFMVFSPQAGTFGSLTRMLALAKKFIKEGHIISFCASGKTAEYIQKKGYEIHFLPESTIFGLPEKISNKIAANSQRNDIPVKEGKSVGNLWLLLTFTGYANKKFLLNYVEKQMQICAEFEPDVIITELDPGAYLCANLLNSPIVTTYSKIAKQGINSFFGRKVKKSADYVIKKIDKEKSFSFELLFGKKTLKLIPSIFELERTPASEDICYCGNLLDSLKTENTKKFQPKKDMKYIFCYFGTGSISLDTVEKHLVNALRDSKNIICYVGAQSIKKPYTIGNVHFVEFIEASEILPHSILTVCHGGLNTITQSLEYGVPLLVFPGPIFERRYNAQSVQDLRVGYFGELSDFNSEWLKDKINNIDTIKENALDVQKKFKEHKGVESAYESILKWIEKN